MSIQIIRHTKRCGYDGQLYLIVPDHASGSRGRYTVYKIPTKSSGRVKRIGVELPLGFATKLCMKNATPDDRTKA